MKARSRQMGTTAFYVMDKGAQSNQIEKYMAALADCVIATCTRNEVLELRVAKGPTRHDRAWHPFEITDKGVRLEA